MTTLIRKPRVAFQGERGAFSEEAALQTAWPARSNWCREKHSRISSTVSTTAWPTIFSRRSKTASPASFSLQSIYCARARLTVLDEVEIKIEQHLIGCPGASFDTIETVQSHPVALAQCSRFFEAQPRTQTRYRRRHRGQRR